MDFQAGSFQKFKAITKLHLGGTNPPMDIMPGTVVEYDGSSTRISGQTHNVASIAGAIRVGWLIPVNDPMTSYVPQPAGVQVRPATTPSQERGDAMVIEQAVDDERHVGSLSESNARRAGIHKNQFVHRHASEVPDVRTSDFRKPQVRQEEPPVEISYPLGQSGQDKSSDDSSYSEGAKRSLRFGPAKMGAVDISDSSAVSSQLRALNPLTGKEAPTPKKGITSRTNEDAVGGIPISRNHSNGATGDVAVATAGDDLEDILKDALSTGKPSPGPLMSSDDSVDHVTKPAYAPKPIEWDKSIKWRVRVKTALDRYSDDPDALRYILSVEDPAVVKFIEEGLTKLAG